MTMVRKGEVVRTVLAMLAGAVLVLAIQALSGHATRQAEAAGIDDLARSAMVNVVQSIPWPGREKIRGVAGLGDGRTFIVYTDENISFYQFVNPGPTTSP
jgi:hypothetical protein